MVCKMDKIRDEEEKGVAGMVGWCKRERNREKRRVCRVNKSTILFL